MPPSLIQAPHLARAPQFEAFLAAERARWSKAVRESGATVD